MIVTRISTVDPIAHFALAFVSAWCGREKVQIKNKWQSLAYIVIILLGLIGEAAFASSLVRSFSPPDFSLNTRGDITFAANTIMTCSATLGSTRTSCASVQNNPTAVSLGVRNNNNNFMTYVNQDSDATTFNSSSATLTLPAGATVEFAKLYWGAETAAGGLNGAPAGSSQPAPNATQRNRVRFDTPAAGGYIDLVATQVDNNPLSPTRYQGAVDVTALVQAAGGGVYTVANIQAGLGTDSYGGWALVVAYSDPAQPLRNLTIFDGYAVVDTNTPTDISIPVSGFLTPLIGTFSAAIGVVAYEGDLGTNGDSLQLTNSAGVSTCIGDTLNIAGSGPTCDTIIPNFFNATISRGGAYVTTKSPNYINQLGFDADIVTLVNGQTILGNGSTNAIITLRTGGDFYYPGVVTFMTEIFEPVVTGNVIKTVTDLNGGQTLPGDVLEYNISVSNTGNDPADRVVLTDPIPANATYVNGSLQILAGANAGVKTDAAGDDQADVSAGNVIFRLGTGANATTGGALAVGDVTTLRFRVTIASPPPCTPISNQASVTYVGRTSGVTKVAISDGDLTSPGYQPTIATLACADLSISKTSNPATVVPGTNVQYQIVVSNNGPSDALNVVFS